MASEAAKDAELLAAFVAGLAPESTATPVNEPADLAAAGAGLTTGAVGWAVTLGRRCSDATRALQGQHAAELSEDDTRHGIETSMLGLLRSLSGDTSVIPVNERQLSIARTMARLERPYERYIAGLRQAQDMALSALLDNAVGSRPARSRPGLLRALTRGVASYFDDTVLGVITEYLAERQRAIAQNLAERRRLIAALVTGEHVPPDVATAVLGIDLAQHHLALILWRSGDDGPPVPHPAAGRPRSQLELAANRAAGRLRAAAALTMPADDLDALLCWLTSPVPFPANHLKALSTLFDANAELGVAAGVPGPGAVGFRRSHLAARDAHRVARYRQQAGVTGYADIAAVALLSCDVERARWFVAEELGPLGADDPALDELRSTALCYLDSGRNLIDTARQLHVHRNTVVYRLAKIERLLGRPLGQRPFAVQAALTLADQLRGAVTAVTEPASTHRRDAIPDARPNDPPPGHHPS